MDTEYIKKCPFCGSLSEPRRYYNSYEGTKYFIECIQCGATSSHRPTEEYAIEQWNKRVEDEYEDLDVYVHNSIVTGIQNKINNHYKNNTLTEKDVKLLYEIFDEVEKLRIFVKEEDL